jgi:hypothetical protein
MLTNQIVKALDSRLRGNDSNTGKPIHASNKNAPAQSVQRGVGVA